MLLCVSACPLVRRVSVWRRRPGRYTYLLLYLLTARLLGGAHRRGLVAMPHASAHGCVCVCMCVSECPGVRVSASSFLFVFHCQRFGGFHTVSLFVIRFGCMLSFGGFFRLSVFVWLLAGLFACLCVCFFDCLCVWLLFRMSASPLFRPRVRMSAYVSVFVCLFVCLFVRSFVYMLLCMFVCLYFVVCVRLSAGSPCVRWAVLPWQVPTCSSTSSRRGCLAVRIGMPRRIGLCVCVSVCDTRVRVSVCPCVRVGARVRVSVCPCVRVGACVRVSVCPCVRGPCGGLISRAKVDK